jgi:hypothetical protein
VVRAWVKLIWNSLGVAAIAAAAQLAIAQALGIIRWDASADGSGWSALLTWVAFIYAVAVLGGAAVGRRALRRPTKPDAMPARIAAALSAGVGASIAVGLAWLPAKAAKPPVSVHPELLVALTAGTAIVAGIIIAVIALSVPPAAGGVRAAMAWIWLVGIGSAIAGYLTHRPYAAPRLAVVDAPSVIPVAWWSGPNLMIAVAALLGIGVAAFARWAEAGRLGTAISGFAGPAVVAAAYLIAGAGDGTSQLEPYRASLIAVGVGLVASVVVAIPKPRHTGGRARSNAGRDAEAYESPAGRESPARPPIGRAEPRQPLLDETYEPEAYPQEPAPPYAASGDHTQDLSLPDVRAETSPQQEQYAQPMRAAEQASPQPPAMMGQPPVRTYEEDYSEWLRDLGHVPGQRADNDREDQRL